MGKKRKAGPSAAAQSNHVQTRYQMEEKFDNSEDEFHKGRDKILLDEEPAAKRRRRIGEQEKDIQASDEEVLGYSGTEDDSEDVQSVDDAETDEEDEEENWGTTKADYYNADNIETEADALDEEKEARRLQQKQLKSMTNADFGYDETAWAPNELKKPTSGPVVEKLPEAKIPAGAKKEEMIDILYSRYPEFRLLARDLIELQDVWSRLQGQCAASSNTTKEGVTVRTQLNALTSYLGAVAMYFAVITSAKESKGDDSAITALAPVELREHALIDNLMASRQLWDAVKNAEVIDMESEPVKVEVVLPKPIQKAAQIDVVRSRRKGSKQPTPEVDDFDDFDYLDDSQLPQLPKKTKNKPKLLDLQSLLAQSAVPIEDNQSDFGDEDPLTEQQAAEKARKKKSLRFYTSQIAQKANRRGAASREAGGDDDVPRKERLRDKQERLLKEAEKRGQQKAVGNEELGGDSEDEISNVNGNGYYESLVTNSKQKKADKQAKAEAYAEAAKQGAQVYEEEQVGTDGKRRITYAIEKNKGLAPKRKKDVRNPRVKKRKKYDEKMKKLGSVRQVYKGGEGRGGYAGELTGIKTNIVKSVKL